MSISLYKTRDMLDVLEQIHVPGDFLLSTFVNATEQHLTDTLDIDIVRKGKKMAPFARPVAEGVVIEKEGYQTRTHKIPYITMKSEFNGQESLNRMPGDTIYQGQSAGSYADQMMGTQLAEFNDMIFRREEWMLAQCLQTGMIQIKGKGVNYAIDTGMRTDHLPTLAGTSRWDQVDADVTGDIDSWATKVYLDSGLMANICIMGADALRAALNNDKFKSDLDTRRIELGSIDPRRLPNGVKYIGTLNEAGVDVYAYVEQYFDEDTDTYKDLIDPSKVIVASTEIMAKRHYGLIQSPRVSAAVARYPRNWFTEDPEVMWVSVQSAPLAINHQPDGVLCATVITP